MAGTTKAGRCDHEPAFSYWPRCRAKTGPRFYSRCCGQFNAVGNDGIIYFSDASMRFGMHNFVYDFIETSMTGRVFAFDPRTEQLTLLMDNLFFANGVAIDEQNDYLLVNETGKSRILKYGLTGESVGTTSVFIDELPGMPDNIYRDPYGAYWVGLINLRDPLVEKLAAYPFVRRVYAHDHLFF